MSVTVRPASESEFEAVAQLNGATSGVRYTEQELSDYRRVISTDDLLVAVDGPTVVGATAALPVRMAVPGGDLSVAAITWVVVALTHRRQGIQRSLIEKALTDKAALGVPAATLGASQADLYDRYGFGIASALRRSSIERHRARLGDAESSSVAVLGNAEASGLLPAIYERWRRLTPGGISRSSDWWELHLLDRESENGAGSPLFHLVHTDGYLSYRISGGWRSGRSRMVCRIVDYAPVTSTAHRALWGAVLAMDLIETIESDLIPLDDPLPHLVTDPRVVTTTYLGDDLWLRPLDVAAVLRSRTYAVEVETVIEVEDALLGTARYRLRGGPDGAACERTESPAQATLSAAAVGAVVLGGTRLLTLVRAGRATGDPAALARLDIALSSERTPCAGTHL